MSYKTFFVHLHDKRRAHRLLEAVMPLARQMDAHVSAMCVVPPYVIIPALDGAGGAITVEDHRNSYREDMAALKDLFESASKGQALRADWQEADAGFNTVPGAIIEHGRTADLIVVSQKERGWSYSDMIEEPERIAIESGRPLLVIPNSGNAGLSVKRVTIAWNGRRESVRAVFDALPILKLANDVNVVVVDAETDREILGELPGADICTTLARHGIKCQITQGSARDSDMGKEILHQATAFGSNLLVMGCYGHSRLREFILGGASRGVLEAMTLPVLMSH
jgi:nucleotide-binding universal stress UspA family protein